MEAWPVSAGEGGDSELSRGAPGLWHPEAMASDPAVPSRGAGIPPADVFCLLRAGRFQRRPDSAS